MLGVVFINYMLISVQCSTFLSIKTLFYHFVYLCCDMISLLSLASLTQYHYGIFAEDIFGNETVASVLTMVEYYCVSMHSVSDADSI